MSILPQKRTRGANYTGEEKILLLNLVKNYKHIIENKKTDLHNNKDKEKAWNEITKQFNAVLPNGVHRSYDSLKKNYENLKKKVRKDVADEKRQRIVTGGGTYEPESSTKDPTFDLTLSLLNKKSVFGLQNQFDCDEDVSASTVTNEDNQEQDIRIILPLTNHEDALDEPLDLGDSIIIEEYNAQNNLPTDTEEPAESRCNTTPRRVNKKQTLNWASRRRPIVPPASARSNLTLKYTELTEAKLELIKLQKQNYILDNEIKTKMLQQMDEEFDLKMKILKRQLAQIDQDIV